MHVRIITGVFVYKVLFAYDVFTDISDTEQGEQEGKGGRGKCEDLPVSLEDLEFICQACDHGLHATHLVEKKNVIKDKADLWADGRTNSITEH